MVRPALALVLLLAVAIAMLRPQTLGRLRSVFGAVAVGALAGAAPQPPGRCGCACSWPGGSPDAEAAGPQDLGIISIDPGNPSPAIPAGQLPGGPAQQH